MELFGELKKELARMKSIQTPEVGWFNDPEALIYGFLNYGSKDDAKRFVPPRPHRDVAIIEIEEYQEKHRSGEDDTIEEFIADLGENMKDIYLEVLYSGAWAELAESTLKARIWKGIEGTTPLVATHHMQESLELRYTEND